MVIHRILDRGVSLEEESEHCTLMGKHMEAIWPVSRAALAAATTQPLPESTAFVLSQPCSTLTGQKPMLKQK